MKNKLNFLQTLQIIAAFTTILLFGLAIYDRVKKT